MNHHEPTYAMPTHTSFTLAMLALEIEMIQAADVHLSTTMTEEV